MSILKICYYKIMNNTDDHGEINFPLITRGDAH